MLPVGALAGLLLSTVGGANGAAAVATASIPMSLQDVEWSDIEASHRGNDLWVDEQLPVQLALPDGVSADQVTVDYRLPDSLQITSFALVVTAPNDEQALAVAAQAGELLTQHAATEADADLEAQKAAVQERLDTASTELSGIEAKLADLRTQQQELIAKKASEATVSVVTGNVWATETERVEWVREVNSARTELNRVTSAESSARPSVAALGEARIEQTTKSGGPAKTLAGALVGTWVAAIAAYWWGLKRGRIIDDKHPALLDLGAAVSNLGQDALDSAASHALADAVTRSGMPVTMVDVGNQQSADAMAVFLVDGLGVDSRAVRSLSQWDDQTDLVGSLAMIVAVTGETRIDQLMKRVRRCQELEVPVVRVILVGPEALERLHEWVGSSPVPA